MGDEDVAQRHRRASGELLEGRVDHVEVALADGPAERNEGPGDRHGRADAGEDPEEHRVAELVLAPAATAVQNGRMVTNSGNGRIAPISRRDCAEAAAITLTTDGHAGKTYEITGAEALTPSELAELYSELSGQPVKVAQLGDTMLLGVLAGIGTPMPIAWAFIAFGRAVRQGYFDVVDPAFERLTGRPPVALRDVLIAHRADLLAVG